MLVLTPAPHPTECLSGYLLRLGTVNGYSTPACMVSHLGAQWHRTSYRYVKAKELMNIAGVDQEVADRVCLVPKRGASRGVVSLLGMELHASEAQMRTLRVCPICVGESGRHEAVWHLKLVSHCPVHRVPLLESCTDCGRSLAWNRPSVAQCRCGANLATQGERAQCAEVLADLLQALRVSLYGITHGGEFPERLKYLEHLDLYSISRLVFVLCHLVQQFEGKFAERESDRLAYVGRVAWLLSEWPTNFHAFIKHNYASALIHNRYSFRQIFDWAYFKLEKNLRQRGKGFSFLTDEIAYIGAQYLNRDRVSRSDRPVPLDAVSGKWGSIPEAAKILGLDPRTVLARVRAGRMPGKTVLGEKRNRNYVVDLDWARQWRFSKHPCVAVRSAARRLGLTVDLLRILRATGVYEVRFHTFQEKGYSLEDVEHFEKILLRVAMKHSVDGTIGGIVYCGVPLKGSGEKNVLKASMLKELIAQERSETP